MIRADSDAFGAIDRIVSGVGGADPATTAYIQALQRKLSGQAPLCRSIAAKLCGPAGRRAHLFTGFVVPELYPHGENDGPLGTLALARALDRSGLQVTLWVDPPLRETMMWLAAELGVSVPIRTIRPADLAEDAPTPDVAIAIEKPGWNRCRVMHTFDGRAIREGSVSVDAVFCEWRRRGALTVGIGDRGNELGFGDLQADVLALRPETARCVCGCGGGVVCSTVTGLVLPAAVSNWGAYGIVASMAILTRNESLLYRPEEEARLLQVAAVRGCMDGILRRGGYGVDGISGEASVAVVRELQSVARKAIASLPKSACA